MARCVLVVEDDDVVRGGLIALLGMNGHYATPAASVAEAESSLDAATPTHVLLDLNLPDGLGTAVLRRVRARGLSVCVAVVTGSGDETLIDEARDLGADAVFRKPPDWDKLMEWVAQAEPAA
jgi:DNA-binding response OmpR family regulator